MFYKEDIKQGRLTMSLSNFFMGSPGKFEQLPTVTPQQKGILDQLLSSISGGGMGAMGGPLGSGIQNLQNILGGGDEAFKAFEAPARTAFAQQTAPMIAERFSGLGAQQSSAFGQALGQAGAGMEQNLAAQRAQLQSSALTQLQQLLGTGMQSQFTTHQIPGQEGFLQGLMKAGGQIGGMGGGMAMSAGLSSLMGLPGLG